MIKCWKGTVRGSEGVFVSFKAVILAEDPWKKKPKIKITTRLNLIVILMLFEPRSAQASSWQCENFLNWEPKGNQECQL